MYTLILPDNTEFNFPALRSVYQSVNGALIQLGYTPVYCSNFNYYKDWQVEFATLGTFTVMEIMTGKLFIIDWDWNIEHPMKMYETPFMSDQERGE